MVQPSWLLSMNYTVLQFLLKKKKRIEICSLLLQCVLSIDRAHGGPAIVSTPTIVVECIPAVVPEREGTQRVTPLRWV